MRLISSKKFLNKYFLSFLVLFLCISTLIFYSDPLNVSEFDPNTMKNYTSKYPYIGLIVDDRKNQEVVNAVTNILQHIPTDWKIQMIIPIENWDYYNRTSLAPWITNGRVFMTSLNLPRADFTGAEYINLLLTSPALWHEVQGEKILLFQTDSVICSNSSYKLTDFLEYDYVGAPWPNRGCCNGGFSLRSRTKMLHLYENSKIQYQLHISAEDVWIYHNLPRVNGRIAPFDVAKTFSVENVYHPRSFGIHKPNTGTLGPVVMQHLCNDCPEVRTITHCP